MVKDIEVIVDIESNQSKCQEDQRNAHVTGGKKVENVLRSLGLTSSVKVLDKNEDNIDSNRNPVKIIDVEYNDIESLVNDKLEGEKRETMPRKERQKIKNSKKVSKPPRPRKGPSLSTSDLRLVKEISELVMKKRARIERLKSLKKMRSARLSPPSSSEASSNIISLIAMMITVLFLIVIIFQGFGSLTTGLVSGQSDSRLQE